MIRHWTSRVFAVLLTVATARLVWVALSYFHSDRIGRHRLEAAWITLVVLGLLQLGLSQAFSESHAPAEEPRTPWPPILLGVFVAGSLALYWPAIWVGQFSDDFSLLARGLSSIVALRDWDHFRPVPLLAWKALYALGAAPALHLLNITLHGTNAWLTAGLAARLGHRRPIVVAIGLLFLTFPAAVEPVVWNSGVFDVAMVTCGLLYLDACLAGRASTIALLWLIGALLSKETGVVLPLVAAVVCVRARLPLRPLVSSVILTTFYVGARMVSGLAVPARESASLRYVVKEALVRPFASLGVPYTGAELTSHPLLLGVVAVAVLAILVSLNACRPVTGTRALAGASVVLLGVAPLWQFVFIGGDLEGSRYLYLPLVGWSLLLADVIADPSPWRRRLYVSAVSLVFVLPGILYTRHHLGAWQEAAQLRDSVVHSATQVLAESGCPSGRFSNVPDSWRGVYIFRNGFAEALGGRAVQADGDAPPACTFTWMTTPGRFVSVL